MPIHVDGRGSCGRQLRRLADLQLYHAAVEMGQALAPPTLTIDRTVDMKTPRKVQVGTMPTETYFAYAAELLKVIPPHVTDEPIIAQLKKIGFEPGKSFDLDKADPPFRNALASVPEEARKLIEWKLPTLARVVNGSSMNTEANCFSAPKIAPSLRWPPSDSASKQI
jgi:hypothetical protein